MTKLPKNYKPSQKEKFMNAKMKEYFRQRLTNWKNELLRESSQTLSNLQNENEDFFDDQCVEQFILDHHTEDAAAFNDKLMEHLNQFKGDNPFPDDISVLTGKLFVNSKVCNNLLG